MEKQEEKQVVKVTYTLQSAIKSCATEAILLYSFRQCKELRPHKTQYSRTGAHGSATWFLLSGKYFVSRQDISGSGRHHCYNAVLHVFPDGEVREEPTDKIPSFVSELACRCLEKVKPYY